MKAIFGLGNPGKEYENTRHNIGFICVDNYVGNIKWTKKFNSFCYETNINGIKTIFVKPLTYMNESGLAVSEIVSYYNLNMDDILIIHDDLDLEIGNYKLKHFSGSGGHNGIKSIINHLKSEEFLRLKIGISNNKSVDTRDYVTGLFNKKEKELLIPAIKESKDIIDSFINDGIEKTMNIYNTK